VSEPVNQSLSRGDVRPPDLYLQHERGLQWRIKTTVGD